MRTEILTRGRARDTQRIPVIMVLTDGNVGGASEEAVHAAAGAAWGCGWCSIGRSCSG